MASTKLTVLGSGSAGNATLLQCDEGGVLIDAGLSYRQVAARLSDTGFSPERVKGIVLTHAHGDHTRGAGLFSRKHDVPVYATEAVRADLGDVDVAEWRPLRVGRQHDLIGLRFQPFAIPHDASETVAFRIETADGTIGFATDIGGMTRALIEYFRSCRVLVVESNHATELLRVSPYDRSTRARIAGENGHLSNEALADFIRTDLGPDVRCLVLVHLSRVNNVPEIAEMTCREALVACGREKVRVVVARQDTIAPTVDLGVWATRVPRAAQRTQTRLPFDSAPTTAVH